MKALTALAASMMALGSMAETSHKFKMFDCPSADPREPVPKKSHAPKAGRTSIKRSKKGAWRKRKPQPATKYADTRQQRRFEARMEHKRNTTKNMRRKTRVVQQQGAFS